MAAGLDLHVAWKTYSEGKSFSLAPKIRTEFREGKSAPRNRRGEAVGLATLRPPCYCYARPAPKMSRDQNMRDTRPRSRGKAAQDDSTFNLTHMPRQPPSRQFLQSRDNSEDMRVAENFSTKFSGKSRGNVPSIRPYTAPTPRDGDRVEPTTKSFSNAHPEVRRSVLYEVVHAHQYYRAPTRRLAEEGDEEVIDKSLAHEVLRTFVKHGIDIKVRRRRHRHRCYRRR